MSQKGECSTLAAHPLFRWSSTRPRCYHGTEVMTVIEDIVARIAEQEGQSPADVRRAMQEALDEAWASNDLATKRRQRELFPDGKPSLEQFILTLAAGLLE